jgi:hypothetical protein
MIRANHWKKKLGQPFQFRPNALFKILFILSSPVLQRIPTCHPISFLGPRLPVWRSGTEFFTFLHFFRQGMGRQQANGLVFFLTGIPSLA